MSGDFPEDCSRLDAWAGANVPGYVGPAKPMKFATGQSNPTFLIETPGARYVLRRKPPGKLLKSAHMVEREYRVMKALGEVGYPVPKMLGLSEDEAIVGSTFFLMAHVDGRIFWDPALPDQTNAERAAVYDSMNAGLAALHMVDLAKTGLADYGKPGNYFARQLSRWTEQYRASETREITDMNRLIEWLAAHVPAADGRVSLVHGDWRIDNMMFAKDGAKLLAVLDWELSTLGHPFADLAYQCMQWRLPNEGVFRGLAGVDRAALGIPGEADYVALYCRRAGIGAMAHWNFYLAFSFFRLAAILQGVRKRALDGNASNPERGLKMGEAVPVLAHMAMRLADEAGA